MNKTFILTQFGSPHPWTQKFIDQVQTLEPHGWRWLIFTPNPLESKGNVTVIPFTADDFNRLCEKKLGINPHMFVTQLGVPSHHITDYCVTYGVLFEDYLKDTDFWGMCGWDTCMGRLDHFISDGMLEECDIFTDDVAETNDSASINGTFCLFRNREDINNLFKEIIFWDKRLTIPPCPRCMDTGSEHKFEGLDEYDMTRVVTIAAKEGRVKYLYPRFYPIHSHDRLRQHHDGVKLVRKVDGSLWELFEDVKPPQWMHKRPFMGREVPYFHFMVTKTWPL